MIVCRYYGKIDILLPWRFSVFHSHLLPNKRFSWSNVSPADFLFWVMSLVNSFLGCLSHLPLFGNDFNWGMHDADATTLRNAKKYNPWWLQNCRHLECCNYRRKSAQLTTELEAVSHKASALIASVESRNLFIDLGSGMRLLYASRSSLSCLFTDAAVRLFGAGERDSEWSIDTFVLSVIRTVINRSITTVF